MGMPSDIETTSDIEAAHNPACSTLEERSTLVVERYTLLLASKDTEMEDLKKRLAATEKQLTEGKRKEEELEANLQKTKVCAEDGGGRAIAVSLMTLRQRSKRVCSRTCAT